MQSTFSQAFKFNQNINSWNTAAVTNMEEMFAYAYSFDHTVYSWSGIAVASEQKGILRGASKFQDKFICAAMKMALWILATNHMF